MYYNQNPTVIESDDIASVKAMTFTPGDIPELTVTFTLHPHKDYNPKTFHLTNGIEHRMLSPETAVTPEPTWLVACQSTRIVGTTLA